LRGRRHFSCISGSEFAPWIDLEAFNMSSTLLEIAPALDYAGIFDRLERSLSEQLPRVTAERAAAPRLLAELMALPPRERRRAAVAEPRFHLYSLAAHALDVAQEEASADLSAAFALVRVARLVAERLDVRRCGQAALDELCERALQMEANLLLAWGGVPVRLPAHEMAGAALALW
jgi:hypothetical protein